ncbi:hypothetical protein LIER_02849 [Lithospermum erythrorhizon]|uniref:Uncharacterized protein n=1 Tax=Lithospermum erythrorhizon TaxID=34254 RepID=A0AAV3NR13_LITER
MLTSLSMWRGRMITVEHPSASILLILISHKTSSEELSSKLQHQVATRESVITSLEAGKAESVLKVASLDEIIEHDQKSRSEQLGIELEDFLHRL